MYQESTTKQDREELSDPEEVEKKELVAENAKLRTIIEKMRNLLGLYRNELENRTQQYRELGQILKDTFQ